MVVNILVHIFGSVYIFQLGVHLGMEVLGIQVMYIFSCSRYFQFTVLPTVCERSLSSTFSPTLDIVCCLHFSYSDGHMVIAHCGLVCITLIAYEVY